jgi:hypothetical protein
MRIPVCVLAVIVAHEASFAASQPARAEDSRPSEVGSIYAKIVLPTKAPAEATDPVVESWIAEKLRKRGSTELRAVTDWIRLAEEGEAIAHVWDAKLDGRIWGCPVAGRVVERTADGKVKVQLFGWSPVAAEIKGQNLPAETGSRRIAVVDTGTGDDSGRAYIALFVGPPPTKTTSAGNP